MKTTENKIGKYLIIIGIAALLILGPAIFGLGFLAIGWLFAIIVAVFISFRAAAWTSFLMAFYIFFLFFALFGGSDYGYTAVPFTLLVVGIHFFLSLTFAIISFVIHRKKIKKQQI